MIVFGAIVVAVILISLIRFGVIVEYGKDGFRLWVKIGPIKKQIKSTSTRRRGKKQKKAKRHRERPSLISILKAARNVLSRFRRKLLIKSLTVHITVASDDPMKTAFRYGVYNAVYGAVAPVINSCFNIRHIDYRVFTDFTASKQSVYIKASLSIALWEAIYVLSAIFPIFKPQNSIGKEITKDGESTNQRANGNNNAENQGND